MAANPRTLVLCALGVALLQGACLLGVARAAQGDVPAATQDVAALPAHPKFDADIAPVFNKYCIGCHSGARPQADVVLKFKDEADARSRAVIDDEFWDRVGKMVNNDQMPPATVKVRPSPQERLMLVNWINNDLLTAGGKPDPGPFMVHRLNNREYANTVRQLLYLPADYNAGADLPADERGDGFDNNGSTLTISAVLIEQYLDASDKAVTQATQPRKPRSADNKIAAIPGPLSDPSEALKKANRRGADPLAEVRANLEAFAPRAYRRPVTKDDVDALMKFASLSFTQNGLSPESVDIATGLAIRAALLSPDFLFRVEEDPHPDGTSKVFALTDYQLASRLSYFLWSTMPDDELFAQAKAGTLRQNLDAEVTRMLADPKAISLTKDFLGQWLEIRGLDQTPNVPKEMLASMQGETEHFFDYIVKNDRPITDILNADYTFVDERLAKLYGIPGITGDAFQKVKLDPSQRGGIITQASVLTLTSKPLGTSRRTSPVVRGKYILEDIFNQKVPPPPATLQGAGVLKIDDSKPLTGTTRQMFEQHRANPQCAACHALMEPYGFALENYDGYGAWRADEHGTPIDSSGAINGHKFVTPVEFRQVITTRTDDFRRALVRKLLSYALGRGIEGYDRQSIDQICAAVQKDGDKFSSLVLNIVKSYPFQNARGSATPLAQASGKTSAKAQPKLQPISQTQDSRGTKP